ncbi:MAG: cytochrome c biogenesis protein DipZ [Chloroflexota bacterium]
MLLVLVFAFVAGVLTILAPCALPMIPLALGAGSTGGRGRVTGLVLGFGVTFVGATVLLAAALASLGLTTDGLRIVSVIVLVGAGLSLAVPRVEAFIERRLGPLAVIGVKVAGDQRESGLGGGIVLGAAIGLLWAPCVGPIMAGVIATAAVHGPSLETLAIATAYVAGASVPIAAIAGWGRRASDAMWTLSSRTRLRRGFGVAMLVTALLVGTGLDRGIQAAIADVLPAGWAGVLVAIEQEPAIQEELDMLRTDPSGAPAAEGPMVGGSDGANLPAPIAESLPSSVALENLGTAPEFTGISAWINSEPLKLAELRGKVVLVEFWTFGCINCIHVAPYVKAWEARYADAGLVVVGVHTPELAFERDIANVRDAVAKAEIRYPVAFDPTFDTWHAFRNRYWPAFFFIDKSGQIRHVHYGEGDYDGSEQVIRQLLADLG